MKILNLLILIMLTLGLTSCASSDREEFRLVRVLDADTILVKKIPSKEKVPENMKLATKIINEQPFKVRFLGIDAPESSQDPWGKRATEFLKEMIDGNIFLEYDIEKFDKYGRTLAYVYDADGDFLNLELLKNGYATIFITKTNRKYSTEFKEAYAKARADELNIWDDELGLEMSPYNYRKKMSRLKKNANKKN